MKIGDKLVGGGEPCFIIAEAGLNHNGDVELAKNLIDVAKNAGSDAVKFQTFKTERIVTKYAEKPMYQKLTTNPDTSQYYMIKRLELTDEDFEDISCYAKEKGIIFLSSAFDVESVDLIDRLGVPAFKVASGEITNFPLLQSIAEKNKPIILSTGMSTLEEIEDSLQFIRSHGTMDIVLLHCVTGYPLKIDDANLKLIKSLRHRFHLPVGFSDHTPGIEMSLAAVALGAVIIEKHFTLDRTLPGPDHRASLEQNELKQMIHLIRNIEKGMGNGIKRLTDGEELIKRTARKSIVAKVEIQKGSIITKNMLDFKRPGIGIEPKYLDRVIGKRARMSIKPDELIIIGKHV